MFFREPDGGFLIDLPEVPAGVIFGGQPLPAGPTHPTSCVVESNPVTPMFLREPDGGFLIDRLEMPAGVIFGAQPLPAVPTHPTR